MRARGVRRTEVRLERGDGLGLGQHDHVDGVAKRIHASATVDDGVELDVGDVRQARDPVVRVGVRVQNGVVTPVAAVEHEGPRADGVLVATRGRGQVVSDGRRSLDVGDLLLGQGVRERRPGVVQRDLDGEVVDLGRRGQLRRLVLDERSDGVVRNGCTIHPLVHVGDERVSVERGPIVELDARAELDRPVLERLIRRHRLRQVTGHRTVGLVHHDRVVDRPHHRDARRVHLAECWADATGVLVLESDLQRSRERRCASLCCHCGIGHRTSGDHRTRSGCAPCEERPAVNCCCHHYPPGKLCLLDVVLPGTGAVPVPYDEHYSRRRRCQGASSASLRPSSGVFA